MAEKFRNSIAEELYEKTNEEKAKLPSYTQNHGKVGQVLYMTMTPSKFSSLFDVDEQLKDGAVLYHSDLSKYGIKSEIPLKLDNASKGDYSLVCENGTEVHYGLR